jgi:hypothetical protein
LWSLGLFSKQPDKRFKPLSKKGLKAFESILTAFEIRPHNFFADFNYETISILFDQDLLTDAIIDRSSGNNGSFKLRILHHDSLKNLAKRYIVNCAKIELWLLGYNVKIDGKNDFESPEANNLSNEITRYFHHFEGISWSEARKNSKQITPEFFVSITKANQIDHVSTTHQDVSEEVASHLKNDADIENAWSYLKTKGMRLWDGIKRIWRWIIKIGKKVVSFIKENIYKGFFRFVAKSYKILKTGIKVIVQSIGTFIKGEIKSPQFIANFSKDMDSTVFISSDISSENAESGIIAIVNQSKAFHISCRILSWVIKTFKNIVTGYYGWAKLLYTLLTSYKELKILYVDLKELTT